MLARPCSTVTALLVDRNRAAVAATLALFAWVSVKLWQRPRGGVAAPPLVLSDEPLQEPLDAPQEVTLRRGDRDFHVRFTHRYAVSAEVLSATTYDLVWTNDLFDVDLGLIWGDHVPALKSRYVFHQDARWLFWRTNSPVSAEDRLDVTRHIGNEHLIPAEGRANLNRAIRSARPGDTVRIEGYLVEIRDGAGQLLSQSSTSRTDTGGGACEIVWVTRFQRNDRVWE